MGSPCAKFSEHSCLRRWTIQLLPGTRTSLPCYQRPADTLDPFKDFNGACLNDNNCQNQIVDIDTTSTIAILSLSTVGTTFQISVAEQGIVNQGDNRDGLQSTVTSWTRS